MISIEWQKINIWVLRLLKVTYTFSSQSPDIVRFKYRYRENTELWREEGTIACTRSFYSSFVAIALFWKNN